MKKTLSLFLVLVMMLSLIPFAAATDENWYEGTPEATIPATVNEDTVTVAVPAGETETPIVEDPAVVVTPTAETNPTPTIAPNALENTVADYGVIVQEDANGNVKQSTVDVVTPEADCKHDAGAGVSPVRTFYAAVSESSHALVDEYVCTKCGMNFTMVKSTEDHNFKTQDDDVVCSACGYVKGSAVTPSPEPTTYTAGDVTATYKDGVLTFNSETNGADIPDYVTTVNISEPNNVTEQVNVPTETPWQAIANAINTVVIKKAIDRIGDWSLALLCNLKNVFIERESEVEVGDFAFAGDVNLATVNVTTNNGYLTYDNDDAKVEAHDEVYTGSTAYYGDGNVTINYNCTNTHVSDQKKISFANAVVSYGCNHTNVVTVKGYAPTATEYGLSDGQYCNACKTWITRQYKIYPNGKTVTGTFQFTRIKADTDLEKILGTTLAKKVGSADKLLGLFKTDLDKLYKQDLQSTVTESARKDMPDTAYAVYAVNETTGATPKDGVNIFNIPYPQGTYPDGYKFVVVQILEDGTTKQLTTFMTNKGIQVETTSLLPVGITWMAK